MRIIAVDDEKLALEGLVMAIEEAVPSSEVNGFSKTKLALEFFKENICDIAFLDVEMRGMTGLELAKELKEIN